MKNVLYAVINPEMKKTMKSLLQESSKLHTTQNQE